jgi:4-amino-4-deoxy-L-arabinose transferase-like glycosyltransferase
LEMMQSGDYVVPRLLGEPYLDKPPLLYWAIAGSYRLFGVGQFGARFPTAAAAALTVMVTFVFGRRLLGSHAALLSALMMLLSLGFVLSGRFVLMDGPLTLFTTVALLAFFLAVRGRQLAWRWWCLAAVACSLGVLVKGPVAVVLTVPPLVAFVWLDRTQARVRWQHWLALATIVVVIVAPWFVLIAQHQGEFVSYFLWKHHVVRFVSAFNHRAPFWYYVPVLLIGMFPSSLLLGPTVDYLLGRREEVRVLRSRELGALALAAVWILAFFSASSCKLPTYILPAVPLVCLLQGQMLQHLLSGQYARAFWARVAQQWPGHAATLAVLIGAGIAVADVALRPDDRAGWAVNGAVLGGALALLVHQIVRWRAWSSRGTSWAAVAAISLLVMGYAFQKFVPELAHYRSVSANAAALSCTADGARRPVVYFAWQSDGSVFHLPADQVRRFADADLADLQQFVLAHGETVLVADEPHLALLETALHGRITVTPGQGARGRLHLLSTLPTANTLVGARPASSVER